MLIPLGPLLSRLPLATSLYESRHGRDGDLLLLASLKPGAAGPAAAADTAPPKETGSCSLDDLIGLD